MSEREPANFETLDDVMEQTRASGNEREPNIVGRITTFQTSRAVGKGSQMWAGLKRRKRAPVTLADRA